jgi:DNA-binding winged helix-turn-helix (wHTH) protein
MNNTQLYFSTGIPSVLVLISWATTFVQNSKLDSKIELLRSEFATETRAIRSDVNTITKLRGLCV